MILSARTLVPQVPDPILWYWGHPLAEFRVLKDVQVSGFRKCAGKTAYESERLSRSFPRSKERAHIIGDCIQVTISGKDAETGQKLTVVPCF